MPELPEVETMVRVLAERLVGQELPGVGQLARIWRHGKIAVFDFHAVGRAERRAPSPTRLVARFGMTGSFRLGGEPGPYTRRVLPFSGGPLYFDDIRRFGRLCWRAELPPLGPDVLAVSGEEFAAALSGRQRRIKALLLDQSLISGLGNIYCDECLFAARVHPLTPAQAVDAARLSVVVRSVLERAIAAGGSTISDFVDPLGRAGRYQEQHQVYGRAGQPCPCCGSTILRMWAAQRGTHYCPRCQPPWVSGR